MWVCQVTAQDVSTMIRYGHHTIIFLLNNGGYTIEVEIHDGPYNIIKNWNYTGLIEAFHNGEGKLFTYKVCMYASWYHHQRISQLQRQQQKKMEASHRTCTLGSFFLGQQFLVWISSFCSLTPVLWNVETWDFSSSFSIFWVFETGKFGWLFLQVKTEADLITAISAAEKEKDSLCFIEVILNKDDTSKELLEWGSRVATANGRPHNPQ